jgi:hypothetical protein
MGLIWELFQQSRIRQADDTAFQADVAARGAQRDVRELEQRIHSLEEQTERLTLAAMAMAEILRDQLGISEEVIEAKVREIDLGDGNPDGRLTPRVKRCGKCERVTSPTRAACLYCGAPMPEESFLFREG